MIVVFIQVAETIKTTENNENSKINGIIEKSQEQNLESKSSGSSRSKINESSHESSNDDHKKSKKFEKDHAKGEKKEKKEKKKKSCDVCTTEKEHKEHRREKKRAKKEKQNKKELTEKTKVETKPPKVDKSNCKDDPNILNLSLRSQKVTGDNFFQKLLIKDEIEKPKADRPSRPRKQNKEKKPYVKSSQPSLGLFLKGKQAVSSSIFKQNDEIEKYLENQTLPRGVIRNDDSPQRGPLFPRSVSNLERFSPRKSSTERPGSVVSNRSDSLEKRSYSLPRPNSSLSQVSESSFFVDQVEYRNYVYEMVHSTPKNARFTQLQDYFSTLDKVIKLESAASKMEIHKLKSDDIVDFDTWRQMRKKEKAKDELDYLLTDLKKAQKDRDFHFRPREVEDYRWKGDSRLRGKDHSVENLKSLFASKEESGAFDLSRSLPKNFASQSGWLKLLEDKGKKEPDAFATYPHSRSTESPYRFLNCQRSRSSLSTDQVSALKGQLNDILSSRNSNASSQQSSRSPSRHEFTIEVTHKAKPLESLFVRPVPEIVKKSLEEAEKSLQKIVKDRSRSKEEEDRMKLSKTLNEELMKRVNFKDVNTNERQGKVPMMLQTQNEASLRNSQAKRDTSPRVCYSLEQSQESQEHNESSDFILVLSDNECKNQEVTDMVDRWAMSADSEDDSKRLDGRRKKRGGKLGSTLFSQSSDSISSGTSNHTVIYQGPRHQYIKAIEEVEIPDTVHEKSFEEIRKNFESIHESLQETPVSPTVEDHNIPANTVKQIKKSFETFPAPPTAEELEEQAKSAEPSPRFPPRTPVRTSSFHKALGIVRPSTDSPKHNLDRDSPQSKSTSSIPENINDEGYSTFPNSPRKTNKLGTYLEKSYIPEKSISNVDLTDTENNSLDDTFGKMHDKVHSLGGSNDRESQAFSKTVYRDYIPTDPTKHSRAYLLMSKEGHDKNKF